MASCDSEEILYSTTTKRFTKEGSLYIYNYFIKTRNPNKDQFISIEKHTGCSIRTLRRKFGRMRRQFPLLTYVPVGIFNALNFLNNISMDEAIALKAQIMNVNKYKPFINPKHVDDDITIHVISSFTSCNIPHGKYLNDFMTCSIKSNHSFKQDSFIDITSTCNAWSSVKESAQNFCKSKSINKFRIPIHYICLRARSPTLLPELLEGDFQITRLCSTKNCISEHHVIAEHSSISTERENCGGLIVVLRPNGPTSSKHIVKIQPCVHGLKYPSSDGNYLRFSCRKMQVSIFDEVSMAYLNNICKTNCYSFL